MTIGIIGAGTLGSNIARMLAQSGLNAVIANRRGPESLAPLIDELGGTVRAGSVDEAASADIAIAALRWADAEAVLGSVAPWNGRIVVDATNPVEFLAPDAPQDPSNPLAGFGIRAVDLGGKQSTEVFATFVPGARVVKAFNHLGAGLLAQTPTSGQRVLFLSGDDAGARAEVRAIIERTGRFPVDLGPLNVGGPLFSMFGPLASVDLVKI